MEFKLGKERRGDSAGRESKKMVGSIGLRFCWDQMVAGAPVREGMS